MEIFKENIFEKKFCEIGSCEDKEKAEEIAKSIVMSIRSKETQEDYLSFLKDDEENKKNEDGVSCFFGNYDLYSQHCNCLILMSLTNMIVKNKACFEFVKEKADSYFKSFFEHFLKKNEESTEDMKKIIEENFEIITQKNTDQKKLRDSIINQIPLIGGEYETKCRRVWLHFLTNFLGNFDSNEEKVNIIKNHFLSTNKEKQGIWSKAFHYSFTGYLSPKIQCFMSSISKLEEEYSDEFELQIKNSKIYDEWAFHFNTALNNCKKNVGGEVYEGTVFELLYEYFSDMKGDYLRYYMLWNFNYLQKTVEKKIYFSVVEDVKMIRMEKDDFYNSKRDNLDKSKILSMRISFDNVNFLIKKFFEKSDKLFKIKKIDVSTKQEAEKLIENLHLIIKLMIPINFLGGYCREIQVLFFPEFLDKLCRLLIYSDKNFYKREVVQIKGKIQGVIKSAIGLTEGNEAADPENLDLYPDKPGYSGKERKKDVKLNKKAFFELNTDIIRLTSNLIHTSLDAQNFLIDHDFLIPMLSFTGFDEMNPLAREATIVLIRYVTDSNERAREVIRSLEVKRLDPDSVKKWQSFQNQMDFM